MNYSSKFNNLLKNLSTNIQSKSQTKTTAKKEEKQETLFDKDNPTLKTNELNKDDLYGGMISISSQEPKATVKNSASSKLNNLLKNVKLNSISDVKSSNNSVNNTTQDKQKEQVTLKQQTPISKSSKMAKLLSSASVISDDTQITETPVIVQTPKVEPKPEDIRKENLEKTIKNIEKYVARIDGSTIDYINPQSNVKVRHYDFTDYEAEYDSQNRVTKLSSKYSTGVTVNISYDENNNATVNTDDRRFPRTFTLNSEGKITSFGYCNPPEYLYEYDEKGKLINTIHNQTNYPFEYDDKGNLIKSDLHTYSYDDEGHLMSDIYANAFTVNYDTNGNIIKEMRSIDTTITYEYDENNNFVKATDENGNEYDKQGNIIKYTSVKNGITYTREAKIAENGQKIMVSTLSNEEGISKAIITDINGFDMSQIVTLSDGTTIETVFDSKTQSFTLSSNPGKLNINVTDFMGMFSGHGEEIIVKSHTVKNSDGNILYTLEAPAGFHPSGFLFCDTSTNTTSLKNLSFSDGERVLVNEDLSLNVTKTDGTTDIYNYNKKTREFEFSYSITPADLTYDFNNDGKVDYNDFFDFYKSNKYDYDSDTLTGITNEILKNIPENVDVNYLSEFYNAMDMLNYYNKDHLYHMGNSYTESFYRIYEKLLDKVYDNKGKNFDFTKDGKIDAEDIKLLVNAFNGENSANSYENIPGIDFNGDGTVSDIEKRTLWGESNVNIKDLNVEIHIKNAFLEILRQDKENLPNIKAELEAELEKLPEDSDNWARELLQDFINKLDTDDYYDYESFYIKPEYRYDGYDKGWHY